jgi:tetratricopeptide (TPR) repeat protein
MRRLPWRVLAWGAEGGAVLSALLLPWPALLLAPALHGVSALAAAEWLGEDRGDERFFALALTLSLPVLGIVGLSAVRLWTRAAAASRLYEEIHTALARLPAPELTPEPMERVFEWLQDQFALRPLTDLVRSSDLRARRWAIELLGQRRNGPAVELLREALQAQDPETQLAASAALQRVEDRLTGEITEARERTRVEPNSPSAWTALGDACRAYQSSRLLDPIMERHWLAEAVTAYRQALDLDVRSTAPSLALARVLVALGELEEGEALARRVSEAAPSPEVDLLLCEIFFAQGRWRDLQATCRSAVSAGRRHDLLHWWAGTEATASGG